MILQRGNDVVLGQAIVGREVSEFEIPYRSIA
jgi:hypothetical protein